MFAIFGSGFLGCVDEADLLSSLVGDGEGAEGEEAEEGSDFFLAFVFALFYVVELNSSSRSPSRSGASTSKLGQNTRSSYQGSLEFDHVR